MSNILVNLNDYIYTITFNNPRKHNAFDDVFIQELQKAIDDAAFDKNARIIIFKANGKNFSAGADLAWMKRMANYSYAENTADALQLAKLINSIYTIEKPTIAMIHGNTFGGGLGIIAACDIAIATENAKFCFSEVKLGLIPAVISPYIIEAIGTRNAKWLFISADIFTAQKAQEINLIQHVISEENLEKFTLEYAKNIATFPNGAVISAKKLVKTVQNLPINDNTQQITAELIATQRSLKEAQVALANFFKSKGF